MSSRPSRVQAVAVLASAVILAGCGTQVDEDPSLSVGPTAPTETDADSTQSSDAAPTTTAGPTATGASAAPATADQSSDSTGTAGGTTESTIETSTETSADEAGTEDAPSNLPGFDAAGASAQQDAGSDAQLIVDNVRVGVQDGYDRVVLDLSGTGQVGWIVQYADAPSLDGSGTPVDLAGDYILQVSARGMAYPEAGGTAYNPGLLLVDGGDLQQVTEILRGSPFEGEVDVYVGTSEQAPFRVFRLSDPERLVIDIQQ